MVILFTHKNCSDGTACAVIVQAYFKGNVETRYCSYGEKPNLVGIENTEVYITDFCFDTDIMDVICEKAEKVVLIDHHKTHEENLKTYTKPNLTIIFDMSKAGCQLTWEFFYKTQIPWYFDYVGDRDVWKFSLEKSREINCVLFQSGRLFFNNLRQLHSETDAYKDELYKACSIIGPMLFETQAKTVEESAKAATKAKLYTVDNKYVCDVLVWDTMNKSIMNEVADFLRSDTTVDCILMPRLDSKTGTVHVSLRSRKEVDSTKFSSQFFDKHGKPGGGHPGASGFEIPIDKYTSCLKFY